MTELYYLTGATESQYVNTATCLKLILSEMSTYINPHPPHKIKLNTHVIAAFAPNYLKVSLKSTFFLLKLK